MMSATDEMTDRLTGCLTRQAVTELMTGWSADRKRYSVALLDLDRFKKFNDEYGLPCGDACLVKVADVIRKNIREGDVVGRYGGEEFVILFPDTAPEVAFIMVEDLRRTLADRDYALEGSDREVVRSIPLSGGISGVPKDGSDPIDLIRGADEALYQAKLAGRNRIMLATSEKMKMKSSYYTSTQLERLAKLARMTERSEAFLLREALDELLTRYGV